MNEGPAIQLSYSLPVEPLNAGLFVSTSTGKHPVRTIDSYELLFMKSGTLDLFEEKQTFHLVAGDALILRPGRLHGGISPYEEGDSFYYLHFNVQRESRARGTGRLSLPRLVHLQNPDRLVEFLHCYLDAQETGGLSDTLASFLVMTMLAEVQHAAVEDCTAEKGSRGHDAVLSRVQAYISRHYDEDISTSTIAQALHYNPDYLARAFRQAAGYTITHAIHKRRIRDAKALLIQNYMNIEEIAAASGYREAGYFRKVFKSLTGMTPHRFRELHSHVHFTSH